MTQKERYWRLVAEKNEALARVRELTEQMNRLKEVLVRANLDYHEIAASADAAFAQLSDEEKEEVRNTNTWGNG